MARVCGVMAARTAAGSMFRVSGWTSTSTGRAPTCSITFTEAVKVTGGVMASSPAPTPRVRGREGRAGGGGGQRGGGGRGRSFAGLPRQVPRHGARRGADQLVAGAVGQGLEEVLEITLYRRSVCSVALDDADLVVRGGDGVLGARDELLGEFLAGAQPAERDRDVAVGLEARQPDQLLRELEDADRLAHLENRDAARRP